MKKFFLCQFYLVLGLLGFVQIGSAQTVIFNEVFNEGNGSTFGQDVNFVGWNATCPTCAGYFNVQGGTLEQNNSDGPALFKTANIDISLCNTIRVSMDYQGQPYPGNGNFESFDECDFGNPCLGNTNTPLQGDCTDCWDYFHVELVYNTGLREEVRLIGAGDNPTSAPINYTSPCVGNKTSVSIEITSQTWSAGEINSVDNIMLVCNDPPNDIRIDQNPVGSPLFCVGDNVELEVNNAPGESFQWFDPNGDPIGTTNSISFSASGTFGLGSGNPQVFSVISTDGAGCKSFDDWAIIVENSPVADLPLDLTVCQGDDYLLMENEGDATGWSWSGPYPGSATTQSWNLTNLQVSHSGTYTVTVTDGSSCTGTESVEITVEPSDSYALPDFGIVCTSDVPFDLPTRFGSIAGNWQNNNGVSGNMFFPASTPPGFITITFDPDGTSCLSSQIAQFTLQDGPSTFPATMSVCGNVQADFDLTSIEETVNGSTGLAVSWFEDMDATIPISNLYNSATTTVYAVVSDGFNCQSQPQAVDLIVTDGPEIMMAASVEGCGDVTLNTMTILNASGNQAYYDMPGGAGQMIPVGTVFTEDTVVYAYDQSGTCIDEQMIEINVGQVTDAGADLTFDLCETGKFGLQGLVPMDTDAGTFFDISGNIVPEDSLNLTALQGASIMLRYRTTADLPCPSSEAIYTLNLGIDNDAGQDNLASICTGETIDINTMTTDNGASGFFEFEDGTPNPQTSFTMNPGDSPFSLVFNYIVNSSSTCIPDTAKIVVVGEDAKNFSIDEMVCSDFSVDVFGVTFDASNPIGSEMGLSVNGCDSIVNVALEFRPENRVVLNDVLCIGQNIVVNGVTYDESFPIGTETLVSADQFGCDSIIDINLTFDSEIINLLEVSLCEGQDTMINGTIYNSSNLTGSAGFTSVSGCDSTVMVNISVGLSSEVLIDDILCPGDSLIIEGEIFEFNRQNGMFLSQTPNQFGCDSIIMIDLEFDLSTTLEINDDLCADQSVNINGTTYSAQLSTGIEMVAGGGLCDSTYIVNLNILQVDTTMISESFCNDTSLLVNNVVYDRLMPQGEEVVAGGSASGCNQYIFVDLNFSESTESDLTLDMCFGDSIIVNGIIYNQDNTFGVEVIPNAQGCDSTINIDLNFDGLQVNFQEQSSGCGLTEGGSLEIDIQQQSSDLADILLDGISVLEEYQQNGIIQDIAVGNHEVMVIEGSGCVHTYAFTIDEAESESLSVRPLLIDDSYYVLKVEFSGEISSINWTPNDFLSCSDCADPEARPEVNTTYVVNVTDEKGCVYVDSVSVDFLISAVLYQPNIFSPNDDGMNDVFYIESEHVYEFESFSIFDRWGNQVYIFRSGITGDPNAGWDGGAYLPGVYIYSLEINISGELQTISGEISLIR